MDNQQCIYMDSNMWIVNNVYTWIVTYLKSTMYIWIVTYYTWIINNVYTLYMDSNIHG